MKSEGLQKRGAGRILVFADPLVSWVGYRVVDPRGTSVGRATALVGRPGSPDREWAVIRIGRFFGRMHRLVPLGNALIGGNQVRVPYDREAVLSSSEIGPELDQISERLLAQLDEHYGAHDRAREAEQERSADHASVGWSDEPAGLAPETG